MIYLFKAQFPVIISIKIYSITWSIKDQGFIYQEYHRIRDHFLQVNRCKEILTF